MKTHNFLGEAQPASRAMLLSTLVHDAKTAVLATLLLAVLVCGIYPVVVWGIARIAFPHQTNGSMIDQGGEIVGSSLIAQGFVSPRYFHPRPSAAGDGYDASNSGGSNLGPVSQKLIDQVKERVENYRTENNLAADVPVPADAVTTSGSGLDPHISLKNADFQAARVAKARNLTENTVREIIRKHVEGPDLGFLGEAGVNVLRLNLALDALAGKSDANR